MTDKKSMKSDREREGGRGGGERKHGGRLASDLLHSQLGCDPSPRRVAERGPPEGAGFSQSKD